MSLPTEAKARKDVPIYTGVVKYFPDALAAVAELSRIGNEQHNPGQPLHWDRSKSSDELDACARHLVEAGVRDHDGILHSTKLAWRALANLQKELEARVPEVEMDVLYCADCKIFNSSPKWTEFCQRDATAGVLPTQGPWQEWSGGEMPSGLSPYVWVDFVVRGGQESKGTAGSIRWDHVGWPGDIVRWRRA